VYFADPAAPNQCPACKKTSSFPFYIKTYRYNLPVHQRTKLYACHTEKDSDDFVTPTGVVGAADGVFKIKNTSEKNWSITEDNSTIPLAQNAEIELKKGLLINFSGTNAEII
jgi:hypothetical protein